MADWKLAANADLVAHIVNAKYGGIKGAMDEWSNRYSESDAPGNPMPSQASFYRWLDGEVPPKIEDLVRWSAVLDLDPLALVKVPDDDFSGFARSLALKFASFNLKGSLAKYLGQLIMPSHAWPPDGLVGKPFGHPWHIQELKHDPSIRADFHACIRLTAPDWDGIAPRSYHFSYRRDIPEGPFWAPYGTVIRNLSHVRLFHTSGFSDVKPAPPREEPATAATEFGWGPAVFRIASLHRFTAEVGDDVNLDEIVSF